MMDRAVPAIPVHLEGRILAAEADLVDSAVGQVHRVRADSPAYIATLIWIGIVGAVAMGVSPLIVDGLVHSAHLTLAEAGYCASFETGGICVGTITALALAKRFSARRLITFGLLLTIIGNLLSIKVSGFAGFAFIRFSTGLGCGLTIIFTGLLAQTKHTQRNFSIFMCANVVTISAVSLAIPFMLERFGIGGVYGMISIITALALINARLLPVTSAAQVEEVDNGTVSWKNQPKRSIVIASLIQVLYTGSMTLVWTFMSEFTARHGIAQGNLSIAMSLSWLLAGSAGSVVSGVMDGRMTTKALIVVSATGFILTIVLLWYCVGAVPSYAAVGFFLFFWSFSYPPMMSLLAELDSGGQLAVAGSLLQTAGFAIGPALGAALLQSLTLGAVSAASVAGFMAIVVSIGLIGRPASIQDTQDTNVVPRMA